MDDAARVRSETLRTVRDVSPEKLGDRISALLCEAEWTPALVSVASARHHGADPTEGRPFESAASVQQIYVGLAITRELIESTPWGSATDATEADIDIIAADVLVAKGMAQLAETDAAMAAVEVVREFGQFEAERSAEAAQTGARPLEECILELAVHVGASEAGVPVDEDLMTAVLADLSDGLRSFPKAVLFETELNRTIDTPPSVQPTGDGLRSGASDTD